MTDLLSRLESLTGPDREVDAEIALANGWEQIDAGGEPGWRSPAGGIYQNPPRFTKSIETALILRPYGAGWEVSSAAPQATIWCGDAVAETMRAATPAIALLIAIMKAKKENTP